jgi:hypothetical protein
LRGGGGPGTVFFRIINDQKFLKCTEIKSIDSRERALGVVRLCRGGSVLQNLSMHLCCYEYHYQFFQSSKKILVERYLHEWFFWRSIFRHLFNSFFIIKCFSEFEFSSVSFWAFGIDAFVTNT